MAIKTTAEQRLAMTGDKTTEKDFLSRIEKNLEVAKKVLANFMDGRG